MKILETIQLCVDYFYFMKILGIIFIAYQQLLVI